MHDKFVLTSLLVAFLWAITTIAQKHAVNNMSHPTAIALFSVMYFSMTLLYIGYHKELINKEIRNAIPSVILMTLAAVVISFAANILYFRLIKANGVSAVSSLTATVPLFVALISVIVLREKLGAKAIAGIAAIVGGVVLISQ